MVHDNLIFEKKGQIGIIRMNRPEALNALNSATFDDLNQVFDVIDHQV